MDRLLVPEMGHPGTPGANRGMPGRPFWRRRPRAARMRQRPHGPRPGVPVALRPPARARDVRLTHPDGSSCWSAVARSAGASLSQLPLVPIRIDSPRLLRVLLGCGTLSLCALQSPFSLLVVLAGLDAPA